MLNNGLKEALIRNYDETTIKSDHKGGHDEVGSPVKKFYEGCSLKEIVQKVNIGINRMSPKKTLIRNKDKDELSKKKQRSIREFMGSTGSKTVVDLYKRDEEKVVNDEEPEKILIRLKNQAGEVLEEDGGEMNYNLVGRKDKETLGTIGSKKIATEPKNPKKVLIRKRHAEKVTTDDSKND